MTSRADIWSERMSLFKWDLEQRRSLLEEHTKAFALKSRELQQRCVTAGGHWWRIQGTNPLGSPIYRCSACTGTHIGELKSGEPGFRNQS